MRRRRTRDDGSVLVMALVVVMVFGVVAASIAGFGAASFKHTRVVRTQTGMRASADAGIRATVDELKRRQTTCTDFGAGPQNLPFTPNNAVSVQVSCTYISGGSLGAGAWTLLLTGVGADATHQSFVASGGGDKNIGGSIYVTNPASNSLQGATVKIEDGDLWYPDATCTGGTPPAVTALVNQLIITPRPPRGTICTTAQWQALSPTIPLPAKPTSANPAGRDDLVAGCRIFFPGTYTTAPSLAAQNYFVSGDYYFELSGAFEIKQAIVIGGNPDPTLGDNQAIAAPGCANARSNPIVLSGERGYGNTWILGANTSIVVNSDGHLELFRRSQGAQALSIVSIEQSTGGYTQSTVTLPSGNALISTGPGNNKEMVIHGLVEAPRAQILFGNVSNVALGQMIGGIVAAGVNLQDSASATGFSVALGANPQQTKLMITAKATAKDGGAATVQAVVDYQPSRVVSDGVLNGTTTVTSATANFTQDDLGHYITGDGIPPLTTISSVTNSTTAVMSAAGAAGNPVRLVIATPQVAINSWRKV